MNQLSICWLNPLIFVGEIPNFSQTWPPFLKVKVDTSTSAWSPENITGNKQKLGQWALSRNLGTEHRGSIPSLLVGPPFGLRFGYVMSQSWRMGRNGLTTLGQRWFFYGYSQWYQKQTHFSLLFTHMLIPNVHSHRVAVGWQWNARLLHLHWTFLFPYFWLNPNDISTFCTHAPWVHETFLPRKKEKDWMNSGAGWHFCYQRHSL